MNKVSAGQGRRNPGWSDFEPKMYNIEQHHSSLHVVAMAMLRKCEWLRGCVADKLEVMGEEHKHFLYIPTSCRLTNMCNDICSDNIYRLTFLWAKNLTCPDILLTSFLSDISCDMARKKLASSPDMYPDISSDILSV